MQFHTTAQLEYNITSAATILTAIKCMRTPGQLVHSESLTSSRTVDMMDLEHSMAQGTFTRINVSTPGPLSLHYEAEVTSSYYTVASSTLADPHPGYIPPGVLPFIFPSRYCHSDSLRETAEVIAGRDAPAFQKVSNIVRWVHQNISYTPGSTDEQDTASNILEKRVGVCRDFSHLAIALVRALSIPARYITAYAAKLEPQDFHACFEAYIGGRWCLFDPTYLTPLNGIVRISSGCDASDSALASLYGGIVGVSVEVNCISKTQLQPVTQEELQQSGSAFILG